MPHEITIDTRDGNAHARGEVRTQLSVTHRFRENHEARMILLADPRELLRKVIDEQVEPPVGWLAGHSVELLCDARQERFDAAIAMGGQDPCVRL